MKKNRVTFSFLTVILTAFISTFAAQEVNPTLLSALIHRVTGSHISPEAQKIIFDYLKNPVVTIGFSTSTNGFEFKKHKCRNANIQQALEKANVPQENIVLILGHDYENQLHYLTNITISRYAIATKENAIVLAFNPEHPGIWFVPSDQEKLLSSSISDNDHIDKIEQAALRLLKQKNTKKTNDRSWNHDHFKKLTFLEKCHKPYQSFVSLFTPTRSQIKPTTVPIGYRTYLDKIISDTNRAGFSLAIQNIIFEYLQSTAIKNKIILQTPDGLRKSLTRPTCAWESVDCIEGIDKHKRKHLVVDKTSACKKPDHFASLQVLSQDSLQAIASIEDATFLVPGPEEEVLKKLIAIEEKPTQTKSKKNRLPDAHSKPKECVIQ